MNDRGKKQILAFPNPELVFDILTFLKDNFQNIDQLIDVLIIPWYVFSGVGW